MSEFEIGGSRAPVERGVLGFLVSLKLALHLLLLGRHGVHGDEMYFLECGRRLAGGYVDHGPLVPWIARATEWLLGSSVAALRLPGALAGAVVVAATVALCAELGGRRFAQTLAGLCVVVAPVYLRAQSLLSLPAFEPALWTVSSLLVLRALRRDPGRLWLMVGAVSGIGLLNKHTMLIWGLGLAVGLLCSPERRVLKSVWPWAGGLTALLVFSPNLLWQVQNGWPTWEFLGEMRRGVLAEIPRPLFLLGQLLYQHPFTLPIWSVGAFVLVRRRELRPLGMIFAVGLAFFLLTRGKPYYLAPAYPVLYAAGSVWWSERVTRRGLRKLALGSLTAGGIVTGLFALPVLPLKTADALLDPVVQPLISAAELTSEFHEQQGWPEVARAVDDVLLNLDADERRRAVVLARSYALAGAVKRFGQVGSPVVSGHLTWWLWGPGNLTDEVVVTVGFDQSEVRPWCPKMQDVARVDLPMAILPFRDLPIGLCRGKGEPLRTYWPQLRRFRHGLPPRLMPQDERGANSLSPPRGIAQE